MNFKSMGKIQSQTGQIYNFLLKFCRSPQLCFVILIARLRKEFELTVGVDNPDGRMAHAVEEGGFHHRVVNHVVKDDAVADFQRLGEGKVAHPDIVAGQA